jgi:two-component system chemotaxis response regulator CheY
MKRVLVVDDSKAVHAFVKGILVAPQFELVQAFHGRDGIEKASQNQNIDLILLDWEMPELDGPGFLKAYRSGGGRVPVIMMTTKNDPGEMMQVIELGANEYIMKPFTPEIMRDKITQVLG